MRNVFDWRNFGQCFFVLEAGSDHFQHSISSAYIIFTTTAYGLVDTLTGQKRTNHSQILHQLRLWNLCDFEQVEAIQRTVFDQLNRATIHELGRISL